MTADIEKELSDWLDKTSRGQWQVGHNWVFIDPIDAERNPTHALRSILRDVPDDELRANVGHIVAAQPENIRLLLDELARLRGENQRNAEGFAFHAARAEKERSRAEAAESEQDALRKALEMAKGRLHWVANADPGVKNAAGRQLVRSWADDAARALGRQKDGGDA